MRHSSMLYFLFIGLVGIKAESRIFENEIIEIFECTRDVLKTGIPEVGLPSLEPIEIPYLYLNVTELGIPGGTGEIIATNVTISGLTDLELSSLEINPVLIGGLGITMKANLNLPQFNILTKYYTDLLFSSMQFYGNGTIAHQMRNFAIACDIKMLFIPMNLTTFRLTPTVETIELGMTGVFDSVEQSALLNQLVDEVAANWINEKSAQFADIIEQFMQGIVNQRQTLLVYPESPESDRNIMEIINAILLKCLPK